MIKGDREWERQNKKVRRRFRGKDDLLEKMNESRERERGKRRKTNAGGRKKLV